MDEVAPSVLDRLGEGRRSTFDNNLATVMAHALEKRVERRYQSVDEMHEAIYGCLIDRGEAFYRFFPAVTLFTNRSCFCNQTRMRGVYKMLN